MSEEALLIEGLYSSEMERIRRKHRKDCDDFVMSEDTYDFKYVIYPEKSNIGASFRNNTDLITIGLISRNCDDSECLRCDVVRFNCNKLIIYISDKIFSKAWGSIKLGISAGIRHCREKNIVCPIIKSDDVLDFHLLENDTRKKLKYHSNKGISNVNILRNKLSPKEMAKKQSILDNAQFRLFRDDEAGLFHDKDCYKLEKSRRITGYRSIPDDYNPCPDCLRRMLMKEACYPHVKQIPDCNAMLIDGGLTLSDLKRIVFEDHISFHLNEDGALAVKESEDSWLVYRKENGYFYLWHNNYEKTGPKERFITSGYHDQGIKSRRLIIIFNYIAAYTYEGHLEAEIKRKMMEEEPALQRENMQHANSGLYENESVKGPDTRRKSNVITRIAAAFGKIFGKLFNRNQKD